MQSKRLITEKIKANVQKFHAHRSNMIYILGISLL